MINNVVYSGVLIPGVIFTALLFVPWIERRFTHDDDEHHLLDRPRDDPVRTGLGAAADHVRRRAVPRRLAGRDRRHAAHLDRQRHDVPADHRDRRTADRLRRDVAASAGRWPRPARRRAHRAVRRRRARRRTAGTTACTRSTRRRRSGWASEGRAAAAAAAHRAGRRHRPRVERLPHRRARRRRARRRADRLRRRCASAGARRRCRARSPRAHPAGDRLHGRPAADRGRALFVVTFASVQAIDETERRRRPRRRGASPSSGSGSSPTRSPAWS